MIRIDPRYALLAAVAGAVVVAGCATAGNAPAGPPAHTSMTVPTDAAVTMADQDPADPSTWVVHDGAVGFVAIGEPFSATLDRLPAGWALVDGCDGVASWNGDRFSIWFAAGPAGTIETIAVEGGLGDPAGGPRTPVGIGLGSTRDEVRAAYPASEELAAPPTGGTALRQDLGGDVDGALLFRLSADDDRVSSIAVSARDEPPGPPCA